MDAGKSNDEVNAAVKLIALYVGNAAKNPQESKFLRIRAGNKAFAGKISSLVPPSLCPRSALHGPLTSHVTHEQEGAVAVLEACKFMPQQQVSSSSSRLTPAHCGSGER